MLLVLNVDSSIVNLGIMSICVLQIMKLFDRR